MNFRFEGLFSEVMEMQDFPCDVQELTMSLCFNTRTTGMMPLEIVNTPSLQTGIIEEGFVDGMMWDLTAASILALARSAAPRTACSRRSRW